MAFCIAITLLTGSYDAAELDDRERAEWPPHPARLFSALVAAARSDTDRRALRWLESQPPPMIETSREHHQQRRAGYVVTNALEAKGGNLSHPGRTNNLRVRTRTIPASPHVVMTWAGDAAASDLAALDAMSRRVPYLGRSTGIALVGAEAATASGNHDRPLGCEGAAGTARFEPCDLMDAQVSVRIPYPGYLADLTAQFDAGRPAWEVGSYIGYRQARSAVRVVRDDVVPSVYSDIVIFGFTGLRPDGRLAARFTEALRSAVLRNTHGQAPPALHGHGADGRPHVAFLALPDVGGVHSDGHLLGLAVVVPDLPGPERKQVLRAVLGLRSEHQAGLIELDIKDVGQVELIHRPGLIRPWGASPERWRQGSRRWISATPVVLDRYPKKGRDAVDEVLASVRRVGLPEPINVRVSTNPLQPGAAALRPGDLPSQARGKLYQHVELEFAQAVSGPVLVGAGRYLGIGLFAPVAEARQPTADQASGGDGGE